MSPDSKSQAELLRDLAELRARLEESEETLRAIRSGEVDALVMGEEVYTLKGAETPYRLLIESMNEGAATLAPDGTILYCNRRFADMVATPVEQVIGSCLWQCAVPEQEAIVRSLVTTAQHAAARAELIFSVPGGPGLPVLLSLRPIQKDSNAIGVVAADLTERKRAEEALRQANESLEQRVAERTEELQRQREWLSVTLSSIGDALIATDAAGRITFLNPVAETLIGWSQAEALAQPIQTVFQILDEVTRVPGDDIVGRVLHGGATIKLANNTCLIARDGREIAIEDSAAPIRDSAGNVAGVVLVFRDVTQKRRALHALRESEERMRLLVDGTKDCAILMLDPQGRITTWNEGARRIKGYESAEVIGQHFSVFYTPEDVAAGKPAQELEVAQREGKYEEDGERVRKDGSRFWASVLITPLRDEQGPLRGFSKVIRDITERKRAQETLRKMSQRDSFLVALADALRPLANVEQIKSTAARVLGQHLRASRVAYAEVTPEGEAIIERGYADGVPDIPGRYRLDDYGPSLLPEIRAGRSIGVDDVANAPGYTEQEKARYVAVQVAANLTVPLLKDGRPVALLAVHQVVPRQWTDEEILLVKETIERTWATVERARAEQALQESYGELERFNEAMVGRELRMIELKNEINDLCAQFGQPARYDRID